MYIKSTKEEKVTLKSIFNYIYESLNEIWRFALYYLVPNYIHATNNKFIKPKDKFKQLSSEVIKDGNAIFQKQPLTQKDKENQEKQKFKNYWMGKEQKPNEILGKIVASDPIRMMLGEDLAPKYRLWKKKDGKFSVMTKMLENFTSMRDLAKGKSDEEYVGYYDEITSKLENFEKMIAVCLLFSKDNVHAGMWGVVEKDGKKYAATVGYGRVMEDRLFSIYTLIYKSGHPKEKIATEKFAKVCLEVAEEFDKRKGEIRKVIKDEMKAIGEFLYFAGIKFQLDDKMSTLEQNSHRLKMLAYQIRAEEALIKGDTEDFRNSLKKLIIDYEKKITFREDDRIIPWKKGEVILGNDHHITLPAGFVLNGDYETKNFAQFIQKHAKDEHKDALLKVYNEVLEFAKANKGKTMDQVEKDHLSHVDRLTQKSNLVTDSSIQRQ